VVVGERRGCKAARERVGVALAGGWFADGWTGSVWFLSVCLCRSPFTTELIRTCVVGCVCVCAVCVSVCGRVKPQPMQNRLPLSACQSAKREFYQEINQFCVILRL
jgi:hypothetical protein